MTKENVIEIPIEWDEQEPTKEEQARTRVRDLYCEKDEITKEIKIACSDPDFKPKISAHADDVIVLTKDSLDTKLKNGKPKKTPKQLIKKQGKAKGLKGKNLRDYISNSLGKKSKTGFTKACAIHKKHPEVLKMNVNGLKLEPENLRDRTLNSGLKHIMDIKGVSEALDRKFKEQEKLIYQLSKGQSEHAIKIKAIQKELPDSFISTNALKLLTKKARGKKIVKLKNKGFTIKAIAEKLVVSESTVKRDLKKNFR